MQRHFPGDRRHPIHSRMIIRECANRQIIREPKQSDHCRTDRRSLVSLYSKSEILISRTEAPWTNDREVSHLAGDLTLWRDACEPGDRSNELCDLLTAREHDVLAM